MPPVTPPLPRATVREESDGLHASIPAPRNWILTVFLLVWLTGWVFGLTTASNTLLGARSAGGAAAPFNAFLLVWLIGWTAGGAWAAFGFAWNVAGREEMVLSVDLLRHGRRIGPVPIGPTRDYALDDIRDLRAALVPYDRWSRGGGTRVWGFGGGTIAFDYGSKTVRFGAGLDEAEAKQLVERMREYAPTIRR